MPEPNAKKVAREGFAPPKGDDDKFAPKNKQGSEHGTVSAS